MGPPPPPPNPAGIAKPQLKRSGGEGGGGKKATASLAHGFSTSYTEAEDRKHSTRPKLLGGGGERETNFA